MAHPTRAALTRASAHVANLAEALGEALAGSGDDTHATAQVVDIVDRALRELHEIRARGVGESRRRLDAAMQRSEQLLKDAGKRQGPVPVTGYPAEPVETTAKTRRRFRPAVLVAKIASRRTAEEGGGRTGVARPR